MKRKHYLLELFNGVADKYVVEAVESQIPARPVVRKNRIVLIAAVIALTALLAGCAAVYFWLQDLSIGTGTYTQYYDDQGRALETPIEREYELFAFVGYSDSPANKAAAEWFQFTENYDPEGKYLNNIPDQPEIANHYEWTYSCYTLEMVDKLNEIVEKYDMKLLEEWVPIQRWQSEVALQEGLGVTTLLKPDAQATMSEVQGMLYPPYNFKLGFDLRLTGEDAAWTEVMWADAYCFRKDYLPAHGVWSVDLTETDQWNYTTADGVSLLLAMDSKGRGFITCQREDAFQVVSVSGNTTGSAYPTADQVPGKKALEQIAECFDFGLDFAAIDARAMQPAMDAAEEQYRAENTYVPEVYAGYDDYFREMCFWFNDGMCYVYHDLNGDGEEELLLGSVDQEGSHLFYQLTLKDGQVVEQMKDHYLCEENVIMHYFAGYHSAYERWEFWKRDVTSGETEGQFLGGVIYNADGTWQKIAEVDYHYDDAPTITQAEAEAFLNQFTPLELNWQPLSSYPLSDGTTIAAYKASRDKSLSQEELLTFYTDWWQERKDKNDWYTHYRIMDVNGDGNDDLLLSGNGEFYWVGYTYRYGYAYPLSIGDAYLCENGILESVITHHQYPGIEIVEHEFFRLDGREKVQLDYICYNKATASWQTDLDGTTISEAEAQAILNKYTRLEDQGMQPLSTLAEK